MAIRIAIASGKGGTGKTTVALGLARACDSRVQLLDCDVEEPNVGLFVRGALQSCRTVTVPMPEVDDSICDGCGACAEACRFGAIVVPRERPFVFPELCHGCGGCVRACPAGALHEIERRIGTVQTFTGDGITRVEGRLDVGHPSAPPLIRAVKASIEPGTLALLDAPPGTSCPATATVRDTEFVVLVAEPTAFGLNDLGLATEMVRSLGLPCGVVVNRVGGGDRRVHTYCERVGLPILAEIADDRRVAEAYSRGLVITDAVPAYGAVFAGLLARILDQCRGHASTAAAAGAA